MSVNMPKTILLVDDDAHLLDGFRRWLCSAFNIRTFSVPAEALSVIRQEGPFPVIVSDMRMPDMDGLTLLRCVRRCHPESVCIMLTGDSDQELAVQALNEGHIFRFLKKPCPSDALRTAIEDGLGEYHNRCLQSGFQYRLYHDGQTLTDVEVGPGCLAVTGYTGADLMDNPRQWEELTLLEDRLRLRMFYTDAREGRPVEPIEYRLCRKDQTMIWVRNTLLRRQSDAEGCRLCLEGQLQDVTERKRSEQQSEFLAQFPKENPNPVLRVNAEGRVIYANDAGAPLLEMWDRQVGQLLPQELYEVVLNARHSGSPLTYEQKCRDRYYAIVCAPVRDCEDVNLYARDITEIKRAEIELRRANRELVEHDRLKSEFVSTVTHELRTPLCIFRNIISNALAGVHGPVSKSLKQNLEMAQQGVERLARIISDFLDVSKIESGSLQIELCHCSLNDLIDETCLSLEPLAAARKIRIYTALPDESVTALVDRDHIVQVLVNLIGNAIKFIPQRGRIDVSLERNEQEATIRVRDNGPGLTQEEMGRIFDRFVQAKIFKGPGEHGTGLGLTISRALVQMHGGKLWVQSEEGNGCEFVFTIPKQSICKKTLSVTTNSVFNQ